MGLSAQPTPSRVQFQRRKENKIACFCKVKERTIANAGTKWKSRLRTHLETVDHPCAGEQMLNSQVSKQFTCSEEDQHVRSLANTVWLATLALCVGCGSHSDRSQGGQTNTPPSSAPQVVVVSSDNIYTFLEDANTGTLTTASDSPLTLPPGFTKQCATAPNNNFLLVTRNDNTLNSYSVDGQTGSVRLASAVSTGGFPIATAQVGGTLIYVATADSQNQIEVNQIGAFRLDASSGSLQSLGIAQKNTIWEAVTVHPNGKFVYAADNFGRVLADSIDPNTATLTEIPENAPTTYTSGNQVFAFTPDGNYLLATGLVVSPPLPTTPAMFAFQVGTNNGTLTPVAGSPFISPPIPSIFVIHLNGRFAYGITGETALTSFTLDSTLALHAIDTVSVAASPIALAFDRSGSFLYVLSSASSGSGTDALATYQFDSTTGKLRPVGTPYAVPITPACVLTR